MNRRQFLECGVAGPAAAACAAGATPLDRKAVVRRHHPLITSIDAGSALSVGNGSFAFTVDVTGLQTVPRPYLDGVPLTTQAEWAWHTQPKPENFRYEDTFENFVTRSGRTVPYPSKAASPAGVWFRENPYRRGLASVGFVCREGAVAAGDIGAIRQELDLWNGIIRSRFTWRGTPVEALTAAHPKRDAFACRIESAALETGGLRVAFRFPYTAPGYPWSRTFGGPLETAAKPAHEHWALELVEQKRDRIVVRHQAGDDRYVARIFHSESSPIEGPGEESLILAARGRALEFTVEFTPDSPVPPALAAQEVLRESSRHWNRFWAGGGCLDLSASTDPRAEELERRAVLSQYLTAIQCSGTMPPQETGLSGNSWYGKSHGEMHWWHAAHFPLWGRAELLERSMPWYQRIMPAAKAYAAGQGYPGARWPKGCGPEGLTMPSTIGPFLIWQQPHPIYFAELLYRAHPAPGTLERYAAIVEETAEFLASFPELDRATGRYSLGPPLIPAQESFAPGETSNPAYELSYWAWGLEAAQRWRERRGLARNAGWERVARDLAPIPQRDGVYIGAESPGDFWKTNRRDHPSFLAAYGVLPGALVDRETMRKTLHRTLEEWPMSQTWSWDYPMMAMTAARLGEPEIAVQCLTMETANNRYSANGHCYQRPGLAGYLPGNGGLLTALAMMTAGWEGGPGDTPGFPKARGWKARGEGLWRLL